jgi:hypothetical protein
VQYTVGKGVFKTFLMVYYKPPNSLKIQLQNKRKKKHAVVEGFGFRGVKKKAKGKQPQYFFA